MDAMEKLKAVWFEETFKGRLQTVDGIAFLVGVHPNSIRSLIYRGVVKQRLKKHNGIKKYIFNSEDLEAIIQHYEGDENAEERSEARHS